MLVTANIFQPLIDVFEAVIKFFHGTVGVGWGLSIVLLTVTIRALLLPLTVKQFKSMRNMQILQPQLKEIQNKYKEDKQRQQQELMKFYKENNVNPLASCLPMVAQLPVFISLFYMLRKNLRDDICHPVQVAYREHLAKLHHVALSTLQGQTTQCGTSVNGKFDSHGANFLFIHDLTNQAKGGILVVLIVLYVGSQLGSTLLMRSPTMDKTQQNMMLVLPLIFVAFVFRFPAGVLVYWITTNFWTMSQQFVIKRRLGPVVPAVATATAGAGSKGGGSSAKGANLRKPPSTNGSGNGKATNGKAANGSIGDSMREKFKSVAQPAAVSTVKDADTSSKKGSGSSGGTPARTSGGAAPPPPPRKKKKRSGRRR